MAAIAKRMAAFIQSRPALDNMMKPIADKYMDLAGYRKLGLVYASLPLCICALSFVSPIANLQIHRHFTYPRGVIPEAC